MENEIELKDATAETLKTDVPTVLRQSEDSIKALLVRTNKVISDLYQRFGSKLEDRTNPWLVVGTFIGVGVALGLALRRCTAKR